MDFKRGGVWENGARRKIFSVLQNTGNNVKGRTWWDQGLKKGADGVNFAD